MSTSSSKASKAACVAAQKIESAVIPGYDPILGGSIKYKVVDPGLQEERDACMFDKKELEEFMLGHKVRDEVHKLADIAKRHPDLFSNFEFYEMTREEQMEEWWRRYSKMVHLMPEVFTNNSKKTDTYAWSYMFQGTSPLHLHQTMFTKSIKFLGNEEQVATYLPMCDNLKIIGCYA